MFSLSAEEQEAARKAELGVRRFSSEGKACIECFRIASARIFETVREFLQQNSFLSEKVILERASIDEFFLDVTAAVNDPAAVQQMTMDTDEAAKETFEIGKDTEEAIAETDNKNNNDLRAGRLLMLGAWIALRIRKAVFDRLGFTMSAGIGGNKMVAKLAAGYGKPNGQAVCFPLLSMACCATLALANAAISAGSLVRQFKSYCLMVFQQLSALLHATSPCQFCSKGLKML